MTDTPELLELEAHYTPASKPPPPHLHPAHDERFTVLEGQMRVKLGREERTLCEGDVLAIPRGTTHTMFNPGPGPARLDPLVRALLSAVAPFGRRTLRSVR